MTLMVYPYYRDDTTGKIQYPIELPVSPHNDLFGYEKWRETVWGSECLKNMDIELLYSLRIQDIYAENDDLNKLENEIKEIKSNIDLITNELDLYKDSFEFRLDNVLDAIRIARMYINGGVYIG